jgi:hypothetical protein
VDRRCRQASLKTSRRRSIAIRIAALRPDQRLEASRDDHVRSRGPVARSTVHRPLVLHPFAGSLAGRRLRPRAAANSFRADFWSSRTISIEST